MMHRLERTQQLSCDIYTAWHFFCSPHNLSRITPPHMHFKVLSELADEHIYEGMIIDYRVSPLFHIPMQWRTLISRIEPLKRFTDIQEKGPYKSWTHLHEFISNEQGVLIKDSVDYELPLGLLGTFAHRLLIRKELEHIFDYRYQVLDNLFNHSTIMK
jgi:ligand-binding SRPBCC domain-containing protein